MIVAIISAVLSFIPAIIVGKHVTVGLGFLCYFISLIAGIVGFYIGKFLNEFVGDRFIVSNGGFLDLVIEKFNALYGPQIAGFLLGLILPVAIISNGVTKSKSLSAKASKEIKVEVNQTVNSVDTFDFMIPVKGGEFFFYEEGKGLSADYSQYSDLKLKVEDFAISKVPVSGALYGKTMDKHFSKEYEKNAPFENYDFKWYEALVFCNKLSMQHKFTPCYTINGSTNPDDWGEIPYSKDDYTWDSVKCNFSANGYRMPTVSEWVYAFCASEKYNVDYSGIPYKYPTCLGVSRPCDTTDNWRSECELLWNWNCSDFSIFKTDNAAPNVGETRMCVSPKFNTDFYKRYESNKKTSIANYTISENENDSMALRLVRTLSEKEKKVAFKNEKRFDLSNFGMEMILVEGGEFEYGSSIENEIPLHTTTVRDFYMSSIMVPWSMYPEVRTTYSDFYWKQEDQSDRSDKSVKVFSFVEALRFCNYLSIISNFEPCYDFTNYKDALYNYDKDIEQIVFNKNANGYRLPTEEEWEYAAKGGKHKDSYRWAGSDNIEEVAWYDGNSSDNKGRIVGLKKNNSLGIYDMTGLEDEFVWSNYKTGETLYNYSENLVSEEQYYVLRGGNLWDSYKNLSLTRRKVESYHPHMESRGAIRLVRNK